MKCPRCSGETTPMSNHDINIDVCYEGCGGIWFDWMELKKMDEQHESDPEFLAKLSQSAKKDVKLEEKLNCPKCPSLPMYRRYWSVKKSVEVDECPKCGGFWLDAGEITHIYSQFETEEDRKKAAHELFGDMFGAELEKVKAESKQDQQKARRFAHALRFICPSYYVGGKQDWGAF